MRLPRPFRRPRPEGDHPALRYRPPRPVTTLRNLIVGTVTLVAVVGGWTVVWGIAVDRLRDGFAAWSQARAVEGYAITVDGDESGGFPWAARLELAEPAVVAPEGEWRWRGDRAALELTAARPGWLSVDLGGPQEWIPPGAASGQVYRGSAETLTVAFGGDADVEVTLSDLKLVDGADDAIGISHLTVTTTGDPGREAAEGEATVTTQAEGASVNLPARWWSPFGRSIEQLALDASLLGTLDPDTWPESLLAWRDTGGTVEVSRLEIAHGPLRLAATGTMALDADAQPVGAFTARVQGYAQAIDALRRGGLIGSAEAVTAKIVLGAMARRDDGGPPTLSVPLSIQNRTVFAGPVPVAVLPPVQWGIETAPNAEAGVSQD